MQENVFIPKHLTAYRDVALLKTLREYERIYTQLSRRTTPAFERVRSNIAEAMRLIEDELYRRGRTGAARSQIARPGAC